MSDPLQVLIVEDSEDDALLILRELRHGGFQIEWERVETAEALRMSLMNRTWDVLISDYRLPQFSAPAALQIVQQVRPHLPFIVVSGTIGEESAVQLMKAGAHDYLMKDSLTRLAEAVRREVREAQIRIQHQQAALDLDQAKERLQLAIEGSGIGLWDWSVQTGDLVLNDRWAEMLGYTLADLEPISIETWFQHTHPDDLQKALKATEQHFRQETPVYECELRMHHRLGHWIWVLDRGKVVERDGVGQPLRMAGTHLDITDRKQAELRLELQSSMLERIAKAEPLSDILDALAQATADQLQGALCSIALCHDDGISHYGTAPNVPEVFHPLVERVVMGEGTGCCESALLRPEQMMVSGIATDPLWQNHSSLAAEHGLQACWTIPVVAGDGSRLATLAIYCQSAYNPQSRDLELLTLVTNIAKIAIEREQATQAIAQLNQELEARVAQRTAALQRSEASLREAQQVARLGSWELDVATGKLTWSPEIFRIYGLDPAQPEPTYQELLYYFPPDERENFTRLIDRAIHLGEPYAADLKILRADGSSGCIFAKAELNRDGLGQVTRLFGIVMDISDRKAIQEALQRSEERARATLMALPDLVFRVNREGQYVDFMASPEVGNLVDPSRAVGQSIVEALSMTISAEQIAAKYHALEQALTTQTVQNYEQQIWLEGQLRYEEVRVAPCGNDEAVFFVRDISDRKQAEAQLQQTNEQLIRSTRLKDEFLANMSHELRTPLNAILGMTEGLQDGVFGKVNNQQIKALQTIESSGTHLLELINDILDVAKIESGQMELDFTPTNLDRLCQSSLTFIKQQALQKRIQLHIKLPPQLPELIIDERRIRQVLINLLNNAVKFTPEGGHITLEVTPDYLTPNNSQPQGFLRIAVIDTGIGIAPENIHKLFRPFIQIDSALNRQYTGTGLGLALVKRITEMHGGRVGVTSDLGQGSCFTIDLPCCGPQWTAPQTQTQDNSSPEVSPSEQSALPLILLAEDNEANINTISSYLSAKGYRIVLAKNGQAAIDQAQSHHPDLILMDIQMPDMDGLEATQRIRSMPKSANMPIIVLTALAMAGDRERCLAAGADDYLVKPVKLKQLAATIQHLLVTKLAAQ